MVRCVNDGNGYMEPKSRLVNINAYPAVKVIDIFLSSFCGVLKEAISVLIPTRTRCHKKCCPPLFNKDLRILKTKKTRA